MSTGRGVPSQDTNWSHKMSQKIHLTDVKPNFRNNSARALYYETLAACNGKTVDYFVKTVANAPPSVPNRGKLKGKQEPVQGWLSFFVRQGLVEIK